MRIVKTLHGRSLAVYSPLELKMLDRSQRDKDRAIANRGKGKSLWRKAAKARGLRLKGSKMRQDCSECKGKGYVKDSTDPLLLTTKHCAACDGRGSFVVPDPEPVVEGLSHIDIEFPEDDDND